MQTISTLALCTVPVQHHGGQRANPVSRITPHCFVGQLSASEMARYFEETDRNISCNYVIGKDGHIICLADESIYTYCSSSYANDNRAITIEIACEASYPYIMTDAAFNSLVNLCTDICTRYGYKSLGFQHSLWRVNDESGVMQVTAHRFFDATECPGEWLYTRLDYLCEQVNKQLERRNRAMKTFRTFNDCPEWAKATVEKLVSAGYLVGEGEGVLDLSEDLTRTLVICDRAGVFD